MRWKWKWGRYVKAGWKLIKVEGKDKVEIKGKVILS